MKKVLLIFSLLLTQNAFAANLGFIIPGSKPGSTTGTVTVSTGDTFETRIPPDRSVYCRYRSTAATDWALRETITCPFLGLANCPDGYFAGGSEAGIDTFRGDDDAIAFISNEKVGATLADYKYVITVDSADGVAMAIECFETTLFGNFNTVAAANPFNFLELSNDSYKDLNARIVLVKNDGTFLSRINISIPAGQQKDIAIHDIAGAANTFGRITVAHNSGLHALRAKNTKYTSSFLITASDKFETRANEQ